VDIPRINDSHIELTAKAIKAMKDKYHQEFGNDKFYVFIMSDGKIGERLISHLDARGIANFNIQSIFDGNDAQYRFPKEDGHPLPLAYKMMAEKIVKDLKLADSITG